MFKEINLSEFEQLQKKDELTILDVREVSEYNEGHIPSAISLPLSQIKTGEFALPHGKEYHIICHSGGRSALASQMLSTNEYQVVNVLGGMSSWRGAVDRS